jgi:hypothetical protein
MNDLSPELTRQALHPAMHQKALLRAAELLEMGWTRGTAARDANGQKVRSTSPQATVWCVVGAVDRALDELLNLDVYELLDLDVDAVDLTLFLNVRCLLLPSSRLVPARPSHALSATSSGGFGPGKTRGGPMRPRRRQ